MHTDQVTMTVPATAPAGIEAAWVADPPTWREALAQGETFEARWIERLFKAFQAIERPDNTLL